MCFKQGGTGGILWAEGLDSGPSFPLLILGSQAALGLHPSLGGRNNKRKDREGRKECVLMEQWAGVKDSGEEHSEKAEKGRLQHAVGHPSWVFWEGAGD